jgi:hypothetical protein
MFWKGDAMSLSLNDCPDLSLPENGPLVPAPPPEVSRVAAVPAQEFSLSHFRHSSAVVRRQADFSAAQGMRFGSMPFQAKPDKV